MTDYDDGEEPNSHAGDRSWFDLIVCDYPVLLTFLEYLLLYLSSLRHITQAKTAARRSSQTNRESQKLFPKEQTFERDLMPNFAEPTYPPTDAYIQYIHTYRRTQKTTILWGWGV